MDKTMTRKNSKSFAVLVGFTPWLLLMIWVSTIRCLGEKGSSFEVLGQLKFVRSFSIRDFRVRPPTRSVSLFSVKLYHLLMTVRSIKGQ